MSLDSSVYANHIMDSWKLDLSVIDKEIFDFQIIIFSVIYGTRQVSKETEKILKLQEFLGIWKAMEHDCWSNSCSNEHAWNTNKKFECTLRENWNWDESRTPPENHHDLLCEYSPKDPWVLWITAGNMSQQNFQWLR